MNNIKFNEPMKYKEICEIMGDEVKTSGRSRNLQLKRWQKDYEIKKEKTYYTIIRELTKEEKEVKKVRHYNNENHHIRNKEQYKQFKINWEDRHSSGIYKIQLENNVYIGQTNDFYERFRHHYYSNFPTHDLLENGAIFSIIEKCDSKEKRNILEEKYIFQYSEDKNYNCINKDFNNYNHREKNHREKKYKKIRINYNDWEQIREFLEKEDIEYESL